MHTITPAMLLSLLTPPVPVVQLRTVAEAAIRELQAKVKDREAQVSALQTKLQEHQSTYLAQHAADRAEIERLNSKLFDTGAASIAGLRATLQRASAALNGKRLITQVWFC